MCGIAGYTTKEDSMSLHEYYQFLAILGWNEARGSDSTGIAFILKNGESKIYKKAERATTWLKHCKSLWDKYPNQIVTVLGHTRLATVGEKTDRNAHPFRAMHGATTIIGVHNGSVTNWKDKSTNAQVDSEAIFQQLSITDNDYKSVLKDLDGSFAIAWVDLDTPNSLYLAREYNPLFITETNTGIFFSSIEESLEKILLPTSSQTYTLEYNTAKIFTHGVCVDVVDKVFGTTTYSNYNYKSYNKRSNNKSLPIPKKEASCKIWTPNNTKQQKKEEGEIIQKADDFDSALESTKKFLIEYCGYSNEEAERLLFLLDYIDSSIKPLECWYGADGYLVDKDGCLYDLCVICYNTLIPNSIFVDEHTNDPLCEMCYNKLPDLAASMELYDEYLNENTDTRKSRFHLFNS